MVAARTWVEGTHPAAEGSQPGVVGSRLAEGEENRRVACHEEGTREAESPRVVAGNPSRIR